MNSTRRVALVARLVLTVGAAVAAIAATSPAASAATCGARTLGNPFARFGDTNSYFLAPGGSFESGASGWSLSNASVVAGNESFFLNGAGDRSSLRIGGSATSSRFCITQDDPLVRFSARTVPTGSGGNYSQLNVSAVIRNASGSVMSYYLGTLPASGYGGWAITPALSWAAALDAWLFAGDGTATAELSFTVQGTGGAWYVDDVYVDPFAGK
jgi:hypothetical protein